MTKAQSKERDEAIIQLRDWIKPGETVYTILDHVSRSGMMRAIRIVLPMINGGDRSESESADSMRQRDKLSVDFLHPNYAVGKALRIKHWAPERPRTGCARCWRNRYGYGFPSGVRTQLHPLR